MSAKRFFDTNIIVYANDSSQPQKQDTARELIKEALLAQTAVISVQVLNEFWVTVTQKIRTPLPKDRAEKEIELLSLMDIVDVSFGLFKDALTIQSNHCVSFWDALILAAAHSEGCDILYSEDLNAGQVIEGVEIVNPFTGTA